MPFIIVLQLVTLVCQKLWRRCEGDFIGMACVGMLKITSEGVVLVFKLMTQASCLEHLLSTSSRVTPCKELL